MPVITDWPMILGDSRKGPKVAGRRTCPPILNEIAHYPILYLMTGPSSQDPAVLLMTDDKIVAERWAVAQRERTGKLWSGQTVEVVTVGDDLRLPNGPLMSWHFGPFSRAYRVLERRHSMSYVDTGVLVLSTSAASLDPTRQDNRKVKLREWVELRYNKRGRDHDGIVLAHL